ncbi:MAG: sigma-70 family RNA polymerase sigma factor, partial [Propionibacteriaceae bacterium]|nr:sigma-70 family RNA polymerase sigma factor [Propionibacteriaceae bacterium]
VVLSNGAYRSASDESLLERPVRDAGFDQVLDRLEISSLFAQLGPRDARLLWLRFVEGRTQSNIAAELGLSQMQISRLLAALLHRLRSIAAQEQELAG